MSNDYLIILTLKKFVNSLPYYDFTGKVDNRREFAMLKSVGMTGKGFNRMMNFECILYGSKALLYGLPAAGFVAWLIYRAIGVGYDTDFQLPWSAIGIAVLSVFLVVFVTMMYSMTKIKKENPIEALKNENI